MGAIFGRRAANLTVIVIYFLIEYTQSNQKVTNYLVCPLSSSNYLTIG